MTPDEQREYDRRSAAEWGEYRAEQARTAQRLRDLGLDGDSLIELARAAADRLERLGPLGRMGA